MTAGAITLIVLGTLLLGAAAVAVANVKIVSQSEAYVHYPSSP